MTVNALPTVGTVEINPYFLAPVKMKNSSARDSAPTNEKYGWSLSAPSDNQRWKPLLKKRETWREPGKSQPPNLSRAHTRPLRYSLKEWATLSKSNQVGA